MRHPVVPMRPLPWLPVASRHTGSWVEDVHEDLAGVADPIWGLGGLQQGPTVLLMAALALGGMTHGNLGGLLRLRGCMRLEGYAAVLEACALLLLLLLPRSTTWQAGPVQVACTNSGAHLLLQLLLLQLLLLQLVLLQLLLRTLHRVEHVALPPPVGLGGDLVLAGQQLQGLDLVLLLRMGHRARRLRMARQEALLRCMLCQSPWCRHLLLCMVC